MGFRSYYKALKAHTVRNRLNIIIALIILVLLFGLFNFWFGMKVMSGIRAYVGGEGLWSKAQKEAVNNLVRYTISHNESDYQDFLALTQVQAGDKQARQEMDKPNPDIKIVRQGFVRGGNHPDDVDDLFFLYRRFNDVSYMQSAIQTWAEGDAEIENLAKVGREIHALLSMPQSDINSQTQTERDAELSKLLDKTYAIDARLTVLENQFSSTLHEGARATKTALTRLTMITTGLLGVLTLIVAILISRAIVRLDKLKSDFVSLASHQLRTPLTAINWSSEALLAESIGKLNDTQRKYVEGLYNGGQRMASLISDLLRVSSLGLGTYVLRMEDVSIHDTLETVIKEQEKDIEQKQITVTTTIDPNVPKIKADRQLLSEILQNLLSNSVKYSRNGGRIDILVALRKSKITIRIADSGIGIPKDQRSQIFKKLFRADNARSVNSNGTGLGLYLTKEMTRAMGGTIWFDSVEGKGSNFYVKLPVYGGFYARRKGQKDD